MLTPEQMQNFERRLYDANSYEGQVAGISYVLVPQEQAIAVCETAEALHTQLTVAMKALRRRIIDCLNCELRSPCADCERDQATIAAIESELGEWVKGDAT